MEILEYILGMNLSYHGVHYDIGATSNADAAVDCLTFDERVTNGRRARQGTIGRTIQANASYTAN